MWTPEQKSAINSSGSILLSASAGSGKTSVLIKRLVNKIIKENIDIDDILILTFTKKSANELKTRVKKELIELTRVFPDSNHLKRQLQLFPRAQISTIHSFCQLLIQNNLNLTHFSSFSLITNYEQEEVRYKIAEKVFAKYALKFSNNQNFINLCASCGESLVESTISTILSLDSFSNNLIDPTAWLRESTNLYSPENYVRDCFSEHKKIIQQKIFDSVFKFCGLYEKFITNLCELPPSHKYHEFFKIEHEIVKDCARLIFESSDLPKIKLMIENLLNEGMRRMPIVRNVPAAQAEVMSEITKKRNKIKKIVKSIKNKYLDNKMVFFEMLKEHHFAIGLLKNMILNFKRQYSCYKFSNSFLDLNDLERCAIGLLKRKVNGEFPVRVFLQKKYKEIMIDEYQDVNYLQEEIFKLISRDEKNIFIVGDIKQSIYSFRNSVPQLFLDKYKNAKNLKNNYTAIDLRHNFRSKKNIINFVNHVFSRFMTEKYGGVDYNKWHTMLSGADFLKDLKNNKKEYKDFIEFILINKNNDEQDESYDETKDIKREAIAVAQKIIELKKNHKIFGEKLSIVENFNFSDIVILARSPSGISHIYKNIFEKFKIPLFTNSDASGSLPIEILNIFSILEVIENSKNDIATIAALQLYNFSLNDLAKIKESQINNCEKGSFYDFVRKYSCKEVKCLKKVCVNFSDVCLRKKCMIFINDMNFLRNFHYLCRNFFDTLFYIVYNSAFCKIFISKKQNAKSTLEKLLTIAIVYSNLSKPFCVEDFLNFVKESILVNFKSSNNQISLNSVQLISIHASKGLEYPIVFLVNTNKSTNKTDLKQSVLFNEKYGIGIKYVDYEKLLKYNSLVRDAIGVLKYDEIMSEELRILYVALTRAKVNLFIIGTLNKNSKKKVIKMIDLINIPNSPIFANFIESDVSFLELLLISSLKNATKAKELFDNTEKNSSFREFPGFKLNFKTLPSETIDSNYIKSPEIKTHDSKIKKKEHVKNQTVKESLFDLRNLTFNPIQVSRLDYPEAEIKLLYPQRIQIENLNKNNGMLIHHIMQQIDLQKIKSGMELNLVIFDVLKNLQLPQDFDPTSIKEFFKTKLGVRLTKSKKIKREFKILAKIDNSDYKVMFVDCLFYDDKFKKWVMIEYKSDNIKKKDAQEFAYNNYALQIISYVEALFNVGILVSEVYLYFFNCNENVLIDLGIIKKVTSS